MITGDEIGELVSLLKQRGVLLYHSCQYLDFRSYLDLGGIPSRKKLEHENKPFTKFETDEQDKRNRVWDKVFLNFQDFGQIFSSGNGVPTVYGPIQFHVRPEALLESTDVAVALLSAGNRRFDRRSDALTSVQDIDRIFRYPVTYSRGCSQELKNLNDLKREFQKDYANHPEISATYPDSVLPLRYVSKILIDTYFFEGDYLFNHITAPVDDKKAHLQFKFRKYTPKQRKIIDEITKLLLVDDLTLDNLIENLGITTDTRDWAQKIRDRELKLQWWRYSRYFRNGTLLPLVERIQNDRRDQLSISDYGLYKCPICGEIELGFSKDQHADSAHSGSSVIWRRISA